MRFTYQTGAQPLAGYTIQRGIHRGGFGEVYFANSDGGKEVALKLVHREDRDVEIRGVTQCLNLKHPNLVNLFDLKTDGHGDHWVVMEYVSGSSLEDVLASFPDGLPLNEVRDWLSGLVAGVAHLHERGIVHRDLKPANVYRENGVVKVGDVGLSKRLDSDRRRQHTQSVGTVYYMAPEVANGQYGPEVDVYSLGVMLYEMITGKLPFTGETTAEILMKHLTAQPDLSRIPPSLRPTLARALEKDPRKRTPGVKQLEQEFRRASILSVPLNIPESSFLPPPIPSGSPGRTKEIERPNGGFRTNSAFPNQGSPTFGNGSGRNNQQRFSNIFVIAVVAALAIMQSRYYQGWHWNDPQPTSWFVIATSIGLFIFLKSMKLKPRLSGPALRRETPIPQGARRRPLKRYPSEHPVPVIRSWKEQFPELANSIGLAAVIAGLLSVGIYSSLQAMNQTTIMPGREHAVFFAATSVAGSWLLLVGQTWTTNSEWKRRYRWFARLVVGAAIGTSAYAFEQFLLIDIPHEAYLSRSAFSTLWMRPLSDAGGNPTWLGYTCFFVVWLGLRSWSRDMNPYRRKRLSAPLTATAGTIAFLTSLMFLFPQWYAMLWAITISSSVQLASAWSPKSPLANER